MGLLFYYKHFLNKYNMQTRNLTLKDFNKVLVSYFYETPDEIVADVEWEETEEGLVPVPKLRKVGGKKRGVVVAIGPNILGWSLCNTKEHDLEIIPGVEITVPGDVFDKEKGLSIALMRADIASTLSSKERKSFYQKVPFTLSNLFESVDERSERYFTYEDEEFKED